MRSISAFVQAFIKGQYLGQCEMAMKNNSNCSIRGHVEHLQGAN